MKLLVFHPHHDALQEMAPVLAENGAVLLFATSLEEAQGLLEIHAENIDGVWVHTDGALPGMEFLSQLKASPATGDLASIVSTESWSDAQCAEHQAGALGANAYLRWPATAQEVQKILNEVFPTAPAAQAPAPTDNASVALEIPMSLGGTSLELSSQNSVPAQVEISAPVAESGDTHGEVEAKAEAELPYLFRKKVFTDGDAAPTARNAPVAWGDAVIPGGAAQTPDEETLKKYLMLREQDVAALSSQMRAARQQIQSLEAGARAGEAVQTELKHLLEEAQKRVAQFETEKAHALAKQEQEIQELKFEVKSKQDRLQSLEVQVREASAEIDQIKERVRQDIRKIRVREKELENRLEIVRRDSEALLGARESKIIELKRRLDLLEFNMDLLQDQYNRSKDQNKKLEEKLNRAAQVVRVAGGMLVEEKSA